MREPPPLRVVYLGNGDWAVPPLEALAASRHEIATVVTRVPRPGRRGRPDVPTPVARAAHPLRLPLAEVESVRSGAGFEVLSDTGMDVLVVVAYGEILPPSVLRLPAIAPVNLHFSLLPALRGASPVQTALLRGLSETGVSTIVMDEGLDTGDVIRQAREPIAPDDDAGSLGERLANLGGRVLVETLDLLSTGSAPRRPQDDAGATYSPKITAEDRRIDWTAPSDQLVNVVRALAPEPAATTSFRGSALRVLRARAVDASGRPGEIVEVDAAGLAVAAGRGALRILELAPAGRRRMTASAFVNGYRPARGERLA